VSNIAYRRATAADMAFVVDSLLDSFRTSHAAGLIAMGDWKVVMTRQVALLFARPGVEIHVAYHPGDTDHIADVYGWLALERSPPTPMVLYAYTKQAYRRLGIARSLFKAAGLEPTGPWEYAAKTGLVTKLLPKMPNAKWNPLRARFPPKPRNPDEAV
jgi:hypothetical protein